MPQRIGTLTIANGGQFSNVLDVQRSAGDAFSLGLLGVDAQESPKTFSLQVTDDAEPKSTSTFFDLVDSAAAIIAAPIQDKARSYEQVVAFTGLRIKASAAVTVGSSWRVTKYVMTSLGSL